MSTVKWDRPRENPTQPGEGPAVPPIYGYYDGREILFVHTEISDPEMGEHLTRMMGSPVLPVPVLAEVPQSVLGNVYVFANGVRPDEPLGPLGFQADVFDSAPGDDAYTPLRAVVRVRWRKESRVRLLGCATEVEAAAAAGELELERPGIVVNMPFVRWPGGER